MVKLTPAVIYNRTKMSVECVKKLNLWGCEIDDISLCAQMKNLQVLSLSVNRVKNLEPLKHCEKLEELYLRKNEIDDLAELEHLSVLKYLRVLWIDDNPCTQSGEYRRQVLSILPHLSKLDNKMVTPEERRRGSRVEDPLMTRSMYGGMPAVIDTIIPSSTCPLPINYASSQSYENVHPSQETLESNDETELSTAATIPKQMSASFMGRLLEEEEENEDKDQEEWNDFNLEDPPTPVDPVTNSQMFQSVYEAGESSRQSRHYHVSNLLLQRPSTARSRLSIRSQSMSPARQQRVDNLISAICVLMDELDANGLRTVIDQAQQRIKKQR